MKILQVCAYAAPYAGNFINSLKKLAIAMRKQGYETIYAFPETAKERDWVHELQRETKVYFLPLAKARIKPQTYLCFRKIYKENPDLQIVHSHFELYDVPATITACRNMRIFWHRHDNFKRLSNGRYPITEYVQYGVVGKLSSAVLISVSEECRQEVITLGFPDTRTKTVLNGIVTERIKQLSKSDQEKQYDFITFGWDFQRKGVDVILAACEKLKNEGYNFKFLLNGDDTTWAILDDFLSGVKPSYLICQNKINDVNELFAECRVFVQASRAETFSYAIGEAVYAGLPVISSDIPGVEWAHRLPTVSFFESQNSDQLYMGMKEFLDGKQYSLETTTVAREIIETEFSDECWTKNIQKCYGI